MERFSVGTVCVLIAAAGSVGCSDTSSKSGSDAGSDIALADYDMPSSTGCSEHNALRCKNERQLQRCVGEEPDLYWEDFLECPADNVCVDGSCVLAELAVGEECISQTCVENATCAQNTEGTRLCMAHCGTEGTLCDDLTACTQATPETNVCRIDGTGAEGEACGLGTQKGCAPGLVCAPTGTQSTCRPACDEGANPCATGSCNLIGSNAYGYCE